MPPAPPSPSALPARTSLFTHLKRALGWNLGAVVPSAAEFSALTAAGVTDPVVQRYAAWRRSLLLVAVVPTLVVLCMAVLDTFEDGMEELAPLGMALEAAWLFAMGALALACLRGLASWKRPGAASRLMLVAWAGAFLFPIVSALLPSSLVYGAHLASTPAGGDAAGAKLETLLGIAFELALAGGTFLHLLPAVLSVIPGAVNGCLRVKSLLPAAQVPGWLLVFGSPVFLLFWLVILVVANTAFQSPLLVLGVTLWAGAPIVYALQSRLFVQSQITGDDARRIGGVKRVVTAVTLAGIALLVTFAFTGKVAGLTVLGTDPDAAVSTKLDGLDETSEEVGWDSVSAALDESKSFVYAYDLSSWQLIIDILAKLLLVTAVFADMVLRATLAAWRNDRSLRARTEASGYDTSAAAASAALTPGATPAP